MGLLTLDVEASAAMLMIKLFAFFDDNMPSFRGRSGARWLFSVFCADESSR
jgi:hypothetical protein